MFGSEDDITLAPVSGENAEGPDALTSSRSDRSVTHRQLGGGGGENESAGGKATRRGLKNGARPQYHWATDDQKKTSHWK